MSVTALSLPVVAVALSLIAGWLAASLLAVGWLQLVDRRPELDPTAVSVFALPWVVSLAMLLASVLPGDPHTGTVLVCHCLDSMPGWSHLCPVHPERAWPLLVPAIVVLGALLPARLRAVRQLLRLPRGTGGAWPEVVPLPEPVAVLHGWWRPTLVVDQGLWSALDDTEQQAVLAHERAHLDRHDPLMVVVLRAMLVLAPPRLANRVVRRWLDGAERRADTAAAHTIGDPTVVAMTLVRCARLGARQAALSLGWTAGSLESRVQHLLDLPDAAAPARPDVRRSHLVALGVSLLVSLAAVPWLHHQLEHLLNLSL
mgnify:CR=1 FL=1